jgi:hypothetical protein
VTILGIPGSTVVGISVAEKAWGAAAYLSLCLVMMALGVVVYAIEDSGRKHDE